MLSHCALSCNILFISVSQERKLEKKSSENYTDGSIEVGALSPAPPVVDEEAPLISRLSYVGGRNNITNN